MKKLVLSMMLFGLLIGTTACRESTGEKAEDAIESAAEDTEDNLEQVGDEIEQIGDNVDEEINDEQTGADDN
ncbi:hypothetical protein [Nonlabens antarcticus]|uniref:hypothetical protein n=1 Tax=Nonlabens antarcticus TaxID=392714 RepID=UPI0018912C3B|nr:hypothetical protein [Nonlabens antarcticus]